MNDHKKRIAIVTGATSGIGEATARKFIAGGMQVVGCGRTKEKLVALEQELGDRFYGVAGDASNEEVLDRLFEAAHEEFGREADIVVANAGRGLGGSVREADLAQLKELIDLNITGTTYLIQKAAQRMVEIQKTAFPESAADIVIIGSVVGRHISPFSAVYGASKFAVHALAEALRRDVGPQGVRVSLVQPGIVISGFQAVANYSDELVDSFHEKFGPLPECSDIADAIHHVVTLPPHINISDIVVRPTRQDYP
ncbi:SDR family oxidoreductase [Pontiella agarivorans]|uniref:SDR family oxidoreductase n=1 Tax=Pontiella agarivorans TaxID=3038953 RepID=A0ABU5MVF5_9BACT|nr:SDR family oxidoreductase [Pontiella agarivorans]MDZ8118093.1 SDR family oxidoreductase [Pontiella agarivorans]